MNKHPALNYSFEELYLSLQDKIKDNVVEEKSLGSLRLYCYTRNCQYEKLWDTISEIARGLILDIDKEEIVALALPKFFNYGEMSFEIPTESFEVFEKYDGSLGIVYYHDGNWCVATKGSFLSEQALWASNKIRTNPPEFLIPGNTYLFEIIYPENRIVIKYEEEMLVLLTAFNNASGEEFYPVFSDTSLFKNCLKHPYQNIEDLLVVSKTLCCSKEGFVVKFKNGYRIKIKGDEYVKIHKLINQITPLGVWRLLIMNQGWNNELDFRKSLPEEILPDYLKIRDILLTECEEIYQQAYRLYATTWKKVAHISDERLRRKTFVESIQQSELFKFVILIYSNKPEQGVRAEILRSIKPVGDKLNDRNDSELITKFSRNE